jgi:phospholipid/cholesterol/gamma-HCH transport system substrate-binding protein
VGGDIPAAPGAGLEKILEGGGNLIADLSAIATSLKNILGRTERGEGFLGAITSNSDESKRLGNNLNDTLHTLNAMLKKIETGQGLAGKLLFDERYGKETTETLGAAIRSVGSVFGKLDEGLRSNNGLLAALLTDPEGKKKVYLLLDDLSVAAASLARVSVSLEKGEGLLPVLLHDPRFSKEFTKGLTSFIQHLDSIGRKLDEGYGTAGKLINDTTLYDSANRLVVGVDESALLKWIIKDRQKAAIKKEYNELQKTPSPTPVPSAESKPGS